MSQRSPGATCLVGDFSQMFPGRRGETRSSSYGELLADPFHCLSLGMEQKNPSIPQTLENGPYWESYPAWTTKQKNL